MQQKTRAQENPFTLNTHIHEHNPYNLNNLQNHQI